MNYTKTLLLLLFSFSIINLRAQKFSYGVKAGVLGAYTNFADKSKRDSLRSGIKPGFSVGGFVIFPMKKENAFIVEGGFSQQGRSWTFKPDDSKLSSTYYFFDMSMALRKHFTLKLIKNVPTQWFVNVGPNINYWISGKGRYEPHLGAGSPPGHIQTASIVFDDSHPISGPYVKKLYVNNENRWLYGINVGIGFTATTLKNQRIITELRMTWGQTYLGGHNSEQLASDPLATPKMDLKCNLKVLNLSVGYIFDRDLQKGKLGKSTKKLK